MAVFNEDVQKKVGIIEPRSGEMGTLRARQYATDEYFRYVVRNVPPVARVGGHPKYAPNRIIARRNHPEKVFYRPDWRIWEDVPSHLVDCIVSIMMG